MTSPVSIVVAQPVLASDFDAYENATGEWASWTPTLANLTLGSGGSVAAIYRQVGKTVDFRFRFTLGAGSSVGTGPTFTPPVAPNGTHYATDDIVGDASFLDAATALYVGVVAYTGSAFRFGVLGTGSTYATHTGVTSAIPFAWGSGDKMLAWGTYIAA